MSDTAPNGSRRLFAVTESAAFVAAARVSSILGTTMAAIAVWIFLQVWADLKELAASDRAQAIEIALGKQDRHALTKRVDRLEDRVFPERRSELSMGGGQ
jgi:hypothetical protein